MLTSTVDNGGMEGGGQGTTARAGNCAIQRPEGGASSPRAQPAPEVEPQHLWWQQTEQGEERGVWKS